MKVEELSSYGNSFDQMPLKAQLLQLRLMFSELKRKFGLFGNVGFIMKVYKKQNQLKKEYGDILKKSFADLPASAISELYMLASTHLVLADTEGKESAYTFLKGILQRIGPTVHETTYNVKDLKKCEGDIFTNFCKLNRSIFEKSAEKGFMKLEEIRDSHDLQFLRIGTCPNIEAFSILGVPELAQLGCDVDVGGYAPEGLGNKLNFDFRRPCTLVNGDESCDFYFYRKGCAPADMRTL
jgi:hypothetical protein